ncbi:MAG TPA: neutral/alkaline non-lysosomal ceramidase N-terminal domain-containing protein [Flavitalea sp.]|nr:neutral/alkaline non-lysosomal ceramidase N-terminal domain-containing protein [Flavitalea sp.]
MNPSVDNNSDQFLAGAGETDITPTLGTFINGDFVSHYAQWIHDRLYSKALVMRWNDTTVAIVVVDICVMPKDFVDETKLLIEKQTAIRPQNILISCTHTHAAGSVASVYLCASDLMYTKKLPALIAESVNKASQQLRPAKIAFGNVDVPEHVLCRRYFLQETVKPVNPVSGSHDKVKTNPFGKEHLIVKSESVTDPGVGFLAVQGLDGLWISLLANYSLHYVGDWDNGTISADYFGVFSRTIKQNLEAGQGFVAMMSNGTSGDVNIWDFKKEADYPEGKFEKSELIGRDIAEKVFHAISQLEWQEKPSLDIRYDDLVIGVRKPGRDDLEKAKKIIAESVYENLVVNDDGLKSIYAREQMLLNELADELVFPVQAFRVGDGIIAGLAGEIFAETGLRLKENAPTKKYFTIGLANGNSGYVPPAHEFELGGYETWRSRTSKLEIEAEAKIRAKLLELINTFANDLERFQPK